MAMVAIIEVAKKLGIYPPSTLYEYVNGDVSPKKLTIKLLKISTKLANNIPQAPPTDKIDTAKPLYFLICSIVNTIAPVNSPPTLIP